MNCPYCNGKAHLKDSSRIYGRSYGNVWMCEDYPHCDSYVGVHKGTDKPLGRMANARLRELKKMAHELFDPMWRNGPMKRWQAYSWLARKMDMTRKEAHIGEFDESQCERLIEILKEKEVKDELPKV